MASVCEKMLARIPLAILDPASQEYAGDSRDLDPFDTKYSIHCHVERQLTQLAGYDVIRDPPATWGMKPALRSYNRTMSRLHVMAIPSLMGDQSKGSPCVNRILRTYADILAAAAAFVQSSFQVMRYCPM